MRRGGDTVAAWGPLGEVDLVGDDLRVGVTMRFGGREDSHAHPDDTGELRVHEVLLEEVADHVRLFDAEGAVSMRVRLVCGHTVLLVQCAVGGSVDALTNKVDGVAGSRFSRLDGNFVACLLGGFQVGDCSDVGFDLNADHERFLSLTVVSCSLNERCDGYLSRRRTRTVLVGQGSRLMS